ncbi:hypothetical protein R0137_09815 [Congregibacter brevis]|uniref:Uncharacterized protein n=1 Tax=Congregibacter brevis TaxID=3081201 RepID=A0ABZ0IAW7_9GAMM|nr:hypothetical protein R0137_09815 [Congregibacter sp. IMCC45268]
MLLRRISKHFKDQNWFAVGIDFTIVVIGVFIGIQVANWNAARIDRADESVFLQSLRHDVLELERISEGTMDLRTEQVKILASVTAVLQGRDPWRDLSDDECGAIAASHIVGVLPANLPSWTALTQAGRTGILKDKALRSGLAVLSQKRQVLDVITRSVQATNYDLPRLYPEFFKITTAPLDPDEAEDGAYYDADYVCDFEEIAKDQSVLNALSINLDGYSATVNLLGVAPYREQVKAIRKLLDDRLGVMDEASKP